MGGEREITCPEDAGDVRLYQHDRLLGGGRVVLLAPGCTASLRETDRGGLAFGHLAGNSFERNRFLDAKKFMRRKKKQARGHFYKDIYAEHTSRSASYWTLTCCKKCVTFTSHRTLYYNFRSELTSFSSTDALGLTEIYVQSKC